MNIKDYQSGISAMNNMFYYAMNIPYDLIYYTLPWNDELKSEYLPKFIGEVDWNCNTAHIVDIWMNAEKNGGYYGKLFAFYAELDNINRKKLLEYITDSYDCGIQI